MSPEGAARPNGDPGRPRAAQELDRMAEDPTYWADTEEAVVQPPQPPDDVTPRAVVSVSLPRPLFQRLGEAADAHGVTLSAYARVAIEAALEREAHPLVVRLDGEQAERLLEALRRVAG